MNKKYFQWLISSRRVLLIFTVFISISVLLISYAGNDISWHATVIEAAVISSLICILFPFLLFSYIHRKRSVDLYFSLPVSRRNQLITGCFLTWLTAEGIFVCGTLLVWIIYHHSDVSFSIVLCNDLWMALACAVLILCAAWVNAIANNIFDAFVMLAAYLGLPMMLFFVISTFMQQMIPASNGGVISDVIWLSPLGMTISNASNLSFKGLFSFLYLISMVIFGSSSLFGLKKEFIDRKSERAEQISSGFFAYPFIINIYAIMVLMIWAMYTFREAQNAASMLIYYVILFIIYITASFVYRRSFHISLKVIAIFAIEIAATYLITTTAWNTKGFGLAYRYPDELNERVEYGYTADVTADDLTVPVDYSKITEDDDIVTVSFSITLPPNKNEQEQKIFQKMETYRQEQITTFYENINSDDGSYSSYFDVKDIRNDHSFQYKISRLLNEKELSKLNDAGVNVTITTQDSIIPLKKYLSSEK